ncbi:MAG: hypothetical protein PHQ05_05845 [Sterolibacterium sp.]|nr:hypothetical protein [Sterolibacterium sp.]
MNFSDIYDWIPNAKLSYGEFLLAKQLEGSIRFEINNGHKELIATDQQFVERGFEILSGGRESDSSVLSRGTVQITDGGQEESTKFVDILNWGYCDGLISQGMMGVPVDELVRLTKTQSQAWAYEQFENGRDAFHRKLYKEALQSVTRAIEGQGDNPGIKTEFRFYFLLGIIGLGSYGNASPEVINPRRAEQAFLAAARYAEAYHPEYAGLALICAGRAALVAGEFENAISHSRKGLKFIPNHASGIYQLGRALFLKGARSEATERLVEAILLNAENALLAASDAGFAAKTDFLNNLLLQAQGRYELYHRQVAERFRQARQTLLNYFFRETPVAELPLNALAEIQKTDKSVEELAGKKTLFAYSASINHLFEKFRLFPVCFAEFKAYCIRQLEEQVLRPPHRGDFFSGDPEEFSRRRAGSSKLWLACGAGGGMITFLLQSSRTTQTIHRELLESMSNLLIVPLFFALGIGAAVALLESLYHEHLRAKQKSALAAFDAAWYSYITLKNSLEKEIAEIQGMSLPRECAPPVRATLARSGEVASSAVAWKRESAWTRL